MWKKLFVFFVVALFAYGCCSAPTPEVVVKYRDPPTVLKSVAGLRVKHVDGDGYAVATGVAVNKKYLITAGHFCRAVKNNPILSDEIEIVFVNNNGELAVKGDVPEIVKIDDAKDLCLLSQKRHGIVPLPIMKHFLRDINIGDEVVAIGSPYGAFPTKTKGNVVDPNYNGKVIHSAATAPGNSGGPLINEHGELIGITVMRDVRYPHISFAVPAHTIKKFLKKNKVRVR
jgi:S1-C subfamily serine protease